MRAGESRIVNVAVWRSLRKLGPTLYTVYFSGLWGLMWAVMYLVRALMIPSWPSRTTAFVWLGLIVIGPLVGRAAWALYEGAYQRSMRARPWWKRSRAGGAKRAPGAPRNHIVDVHWWRRLRELGPGLYTMYVTGVMGTGFGVWYLVMVLADPSAPARMAIVTLCAIAIAPLVGLAAWAFFERAYQRTLRAPSLDG